MALHKILVIAARPVLEWISCVLGEGQFDVVYVSTGLEAIRSLSWRPPDLVVVELTLPDTDGIRMIRAIRDADTEVPVIGLTGGEELSTIIEAMELGVCGFIERPADAEKLKGSIRRALRIADMAEKNTLPANRKNCISDLSRLVVGKAAGMTEILEKMAVISARRKSALISGEDGTGKVLVCRTIHDSGVTKRHPFVAVDLPALPDTLIERVLFGEAATPKGDVSKDRKGLFELAGEGTILLNEISEVSPDLQERLLAVLRDKEFKPVGVNTSIPVKARVLATTDKDLGELVRAGKFREDLFYTIADSAIDIPPLRERKSDIPRLVVHFLRKINKESNKGVKRIPGETIELLKEHDWPGNVGELESVLARAILAAEGDVLEKKYIESQWNGNGSFHDYQQHSFADSEEREHIRLVLEETNWDKRESARLLNISRQTLYNKIKMYGILPT